MGNETPNIIDDSLYNLLRDENIAEFNQRRAAGEHLDLRGLDFRGIDLRGLETDGLDFSNCYLRNANLAGLNLQNCPMDGASMKEANISGTFFPAELSPQEILLSLRYGTRLRYRK